ncbi:MAG: ribosomal-protein-alanine N-acetyltransferase [Ruminococcaceae bacterium]|nr:ribosomal-protein-alanine N-acetyltransferase [Oscillospiraceae bacterium]
MVIPFDTCHIKEVAEIEKTCFSSPWSEGALKESLDSDFSHFAVYESDGKVLGYIGLYAVAGEGSITNVAVHPNARGQGIGKALVDYTIKKGEELSLEYITLEVRVTNVSAKKLYEKCHFKEVGVRRNFYTKPTEDAIIMNYFYNKEKTN